MSGIKDVLQRWILMVAQLLLVLSELIEKCEIC
jgi:hypothetical protein